jgi:uncharacterized RDD family membrane protein YckC
MYCSKCGYNNLPDAEYCLNCDLDLKDDSCGPAQTSSAIVIYAGLRARLMAAFLDTLMIGAFIISGIIVLAIVIAYSGRDNIVFHPLALPLFYSFIACVTLAYFLLMESGAQGITFGQRCMNIRVLDTNFSQLTSSRSVALLIARLISLLTLNLGFLTRPFTRHKQALHDLATRTIVLRESESRKIPVAATLLVLFYAVMVPLFAMFATVGLPMYQQQIQKVQIEHGIKRGKDASLAVARFYHNNGRVPASLGDIIKISPSPHVSAVEINPQTGVITVTFSDRVRKAIINKHVQFTPALAADKNLIWKCHSEDIEARLLPVVCR